ncbi:MAG: TonB-dependent receptor [Cytophagia bacterium]|nr:TonB-dependent receptor [Cytophagia bacterium]
MNVIMKRLIYLLLMVSSSAVAQKISLKGKLLDDTNTPLPSATVMVLNPTDSSLVNFSISNTEGFFEIKNLTRSNYILKVSYVGLATFSKMVEPKEGETTIELGELKLQQQSQQLNEIVVKGEKAPVIIKKDTIEFNAPSFKTKQNANVEDLLKKLPGVEVESDGSIRAQGEQVQQVTVDGKEFFGRDPKVATQNLPANAVDKVQIFDKKSDQATFSGIDDGQRQKTINLELKEEYKNGFFGNATGGYGTDDRYTGKLSLNRFKKNQQLSFLLMGNNINEQGFSIDDYMNFSGGSQQMMGARGGGALRLTFNAGGGNTNQGGAQVNFGQRLNGIMSNYGGGVNFNQDFSKNTTLQSNYFYNQLEHDVLQGLERENFFGDSSTFLNQNSRQYNSNYNHRVNLVVDHKIDSANSVKLTTTFVNNQAESNSATQSETRADNGELINDGNSNTYSSQNINNFNTNALLRHRFAKKGRTISSNLTFGYSQNESDGSVQSDNNFYKPFLISQELNQINNQLTENMTLGATLSYTEPLGNRRYLEFNYNFNQNLNDVDRKVYDVEESGNVLNENLSAQYTSDYQYHRPGFNFRVNRTKYSVTLGSSMQYTKLFGDNITTGETISKPYQNILPTAMNVVCVFQNQ